MRDESPTAPSRIFLAYGERLRDRARWFLGSEADADDVVQEVMVGLLRQPNVLEGVDRVAGWLLTVVRRRCVDLLRSSSRRPDRRRLEGIDELLAGHEDPAAAAERDDLAELVAACVDELPDSQRFAFIANVLDGRTFREISEQTGIPMGTLMARKKKAVDTIRAVLRERGELPGATDTGKGTSS